MNTRVANAFLSSILALAIGCAQPQLFKRYATADYAEARTADEHAQLSGFVLEERVIEAPEFLLQLGSQGQASFIKAFSDKTNSEQDFTQALARGLIVKPSQASTGGRLRFTKQIVISVDKANPIAPADRIARLAVRISNPAGARFVSWDKFATRYETVELGKVIFKGADTVDVGVDAATPSDMASGSARLGLQAKSELNEEGALRQRYVGISGTLATNEARMTLESIAGIDLAGNTVLDLVIEVLPAAIAHQVLTIEPVEGRELARRSLDEGGSPPARPEPLRRGDGSRAESSGPETSASGAIQISRRFIDYPAHARPVVCELTGQYLLRHVLDRAETLIEGDDTVQFVLGNFRNQQLELVSADELAMHVWSVQLPDEQMIYVDPVGLAEFASYQEATDFVRAVNASDDRLESSYRLKRGGRSGAILEEAERSQLQIVARRIN